MRYERIARKPFIHNDLLCSLHMIYSFSEFVKTAWTVSYWRLVVKQPCVLSFCLFSVGKWSFQRNCFCRLSTLRLSTMFRLHLQSLWLKSTLEKGGEAVFDEIQCWDILCPLSSKRTTSKFSNSTISFHSTHARLKFGWKRINAIKDGEGKPVR